MNREKKTNECLTRNLKMRWTLLLTALLFISPSAFAVDPPSSVPMLPLCEILTPPAAMSQPVENAAEQVAQRGCCSHHGGVAGCSKEGRAVCRDGSLSPSCGC